MSPRPRKREHRGHPAGWRWKNGAWRYQVPKDQRHRWDGKTEFTLGKSLTEAYHTWAERCGERDIFTVSDLMDRYLLEGLADKSPKTVESYSVSIRKLRPVFGALRPEDIKPKDVRKYHAMAVKKHGKTTSDHDVQTLRAMLSQAVEWGVIESNHLLGQVRLKRRPPRDRLVTNAELTAALVHATPLLRAYIRVKLATGLRRRDILHLAVANVQDDGLHVRTSKTGKRLVFAWTDEFKATIDAILATGPRRIASAPLFVNRKGKPYMDEKGAANGFDSLWQRFMAKCVAAGIERFQERDLRAKVATDSASLLEASERLGHASPETTQRVYRRGATRVSPLSYSRGAIKDLGEDSGS